MFVLRICNLLKMFKGLMHLLVSFALEWLPCERKETPLNVESGQTHSSLEFAVVANLNKVRCNNNGWIAIAMMEIQQNGQI